MFNYLRKAGTVDVSVVIRIIDSTDGTPETGVVYNTAGIDLEYRREGATSTDITEATLAGLDAAHADGGFLHIGNGYYRLDLPDAACAAGAVGVLVHGTVTGMVVIGCYIQLVTYDPFDSVRLGLTALPNAAADAAGGLPISDAGGLDLDTKLANTNEVTAARLSELDAATAGKLAYVADTIAVDVAGLDGAAMRGTDNAALASVCTEARLAELAAANLPTDIDTLLTRIVGTLAAGTHNPQGGDAYTRLGAPAGASVSADIAAIEGQTDDIGAAGAGLTAIPGMVWDHVGTVLSLAMELILERIYEMVNNKMTVNETSGDVALRNLGDTATVATGNVASSSGTTTRAQLAWV